MSPQPIGPEELDTPPIIDFRALRGWVRIGLRAIRRRKRVVGIVTLAVFGLAAIVLALMPRTYSVSCRLLAQRSQVLQIRGDQPGGEGSPTRAAAELILKRDNLIGIVKQTDLVKEWFARREPIFKLKDFLTNLVMKPRTEQQNIEMLADVLKTRTFVQADDNTVNIQIDWRDGQIALRLVSAAQRSFLEARHVQEVATIAESKAILDGHAAEVREQIDAEVAKLQGLRERKEAQEKRKVADSRAAAAAEVSSAAPPVARPVTPAPEPSATVSPAEAQARARRMSELPVMIETNERTINELESFRLRRLSELQAKLQEQRAIYTDAHPAVADVKEALAAAAHESPQVTKLRAETKQLRGELEKLRGGAAVSATPRSYGGGGHAAPSSGRGLGDVIRIEQESADERDPEIEFARSRLRFAIETFQQLEDQIHKANIDLETAQAAFKYRYTVVTPPELPRGPVAPKVPLILIAALIGGALIGVVTAVGLELREGIIFEPWQIEQQLSLRVLSIVTAPQLPRAGSSNRSD